MRIPSVHSTPTGRLIKNTQRQVKLSVSQPPSAGPMIGPSMVPMPQIAIAWPCRSGGLLRSSTDCDKGTNAAPHMPCRTR